ncbi:LLM class flavin-dependent oxidoreductase [Cumulibacter manganitolerans]|uniref:LLM class flavin-dependent oxidoreductase n=1 Tax=Cumulibacter manganitolerans TaxID=1884992 RepID=UPI0012953D8E|nr:LLM class flavin-dependent oxidoreductase [Cumulibacter manganitolerans]
MRIAVTYGSSTDFPAVIDDVVAYEEAGIDAVWLGESYGYDAISSLGALAYATSRIQIGSGIIPVHTRSAPLIAQTAAGLDALSGGRFALGIGTSGPAVVEGWHGRAYAAPVRTVAETIQVCRAAWARERVANDFLGVPAGDRRPLKMMARPPRADIPIFVAGLGPRSVRSLAAHADGWLTVMFWPERAQSVWGEQLAEGSARRSADLAPLQITAPVYVAIDPDDDSHELAMRQNAAHYVSVMGPPRDNFYYDLMCRYGLQAEADAVTEAYLAKDVERAARLVPDEFVAATSLIGSAEHVRERVEAFAAAGVTMLNTTLAGESRQERIEQLRRLRAITAEVPQPTS